jgi:hypothetical protein
MNMHTRHTRCTDCTNIWRVLAYKTGSLFEKIDKILQFFKRENRV